METLCVRHLADSLVKRNCSLEELDLQKCGMTQESLVVIAKLIQTKFKVETLNLKSNGVGDESARKLLAAIKVNPNILKVRLDMNPAASSVIAQIEQALAEN